MKLWLATAALALVMGCEYYDTRARPLPDSFSVTTLEGKTLRAEDLRGHPVVIHAWLPG